MIYQYIFIMPSNLAHFVTQSVVQKQFIPSQLIK